MKFTNSILLGPSLYFLIFSAYLELNPSITNVWYRIGVDGAKHINLHSYWHFITRPFSMIEMWYPSNFDINYFVGAIVTTGILYLMEPKLA